MSSHKVELEYIRISWRTPFSRSAPTRGALELPLSAAVAAHATRAAVTRNLPRIPRFMATSSYLYIRRRGPPGLQAIVLHVRQPIPHGRGSAQSRDREGSVAYDSLFIPRLAIAARSAAAPPAAPESPRHRCADRSPRS